MESIARTISFLNSIGSLEVDKNGFATRTRSPINQPFDVSRRKKNNFLFFFFNRNLNLQKKNKRVMIETLSKTSFFMISVFWRYFLYQKNENVGYFWRIT